MPVRLLIDEMEKTIIHIMNIKISAKLLHPLHRGIFHKATGIRDQTGQLEAVGVL